MRRRSIWPWSKTKQNSKSEYENEKGRLFCETHLDGIDLRPQFPSFVGSDGSGDNRSRNSTSTSESGFRGNENVRNVLVFTEEGQVKENFNGFGIGSHDDEFTDTSVEGLQRFKDMESSVLSRKRKSRGRGRALTLVASLAPFLSCCETNEYPRVSCTASMSLWERYFRNEPACSEKPTKNNIQHSSVPCLHPRKGVCEQYWTYLLNEVEDRVGESRIGERESFGVDFSHFFWRSLRVSSLVVVVVKRVSSRQGSNCDHCSFRWVEREVREIDDFFFFD